WNPPTLKYDEYMREVVYRYFVETFLPVGNRDRRIKDIDGFLAVFDEYLDLAISLVGPMTQSGFIEGTSLSPLISGLMIEIGKDKYSDDFTKAYEYLDQNFELVSHIAAQYGFSIDRNIPWRLVADIRSEAMQEYMYGVPIDEFDTNYPDPAACDPTLEDRELAPMAYGYSLVPGMEDVRRHIAVHFDDEGVPQPGYEEYQAARDATSQQEVFQVLFESAYTETWSTDLDVLEEYILGFYNTFAASVPITSVRDEYVQTDCIPNIELVSRQPIEEDEFKARYGDRWKLKTFYLARLNERDPERPAKIRRKQIQQVMNVYNLSSTNQYMRALRYAQETFIGPYDTNPLTLSTVGDIIEGSGEQNDIPDIGRQVGMRRNLYTG
nr:hypothetical protein [Gammaproteobacteria bacterium]